MKVFHRNTQIVVLPGEVLQDFRGETATFVSFEEPRHPGFSGKIHVRLPNGQYRIYFPSVFNVEIKE